jgi:AmmeMemoRadiSam system protein A
MTDSAKEILLKTARESIESQLFKRQPLFPASVPEIMKPCGAFVTLKSNGNLRGCIGHMVASKPLFETVKEVAQLSAFNDTRFSSMTPQEWPSVKIEISALSIFEHISDLGYIRTGVHGVVIRKSGRSAVFLPQVAPEQGWDRDTMLTHLCQKAGLPPDAWKSPEAYLEIFTAEVFGE